MRARSMMLVGLVVPGLVLMACSCEEEPPPSSREREGVRLISAGAEPRRTLRYAIDDTLERTRVECEIRASTEAEEHTTRFSLGLETSTRPVAGGDTFDQRIRIAAADADPADDPSQARALAQLTGATFSARIGARGWYEERVLPAIEGGDAILTASRDAVADLVLDASTLPEEPVGVGAEWEGTGTVQQGPGRAGPRKRTRYTLVGFEGEHAVRVGVRIRQDAVAGTHAEGRGELVVDLRRAHPEGELTHDIVRIVETGSGTVEVRQRVRVRVAPQ